MIIKMKKVGDRIGVWVINVPEKTMKVTFWHSEFWALEYIFQSGQ